MNKRNNVYREVSKLPEKARSVAEFAGAEKITVAQVYKRWKRHVQDGIDIPFEIVVCKNFNFIIPKK